MTVSRRGVLRRPVLFLRSALVLCLVMSGRTSAASAQTGPYEEGIVELVAERLPPLTLIVLVDSAGSMLLPLEHVTYYLGLAAAWSGPVLTVPRLAGGAAQLDTATNTLTVGRSSVQLAPAEITLHGPLVYLRAERVAALLEATVHVDYATLSVAIAREVAFPAQQRIIAEQRRAVLLARQRRQEENREMQAVAYAPLSGGGIVDWQIATNGLDPTRLTTVRSDAGVAAFGGDLRAGAVFEAGSDAADHVRDAALRYHRVFPQGRYIAQVSAGDIVTNGLFARFLRGIEISNRPFLRDHELSAVLVQPDLPTGWEYEVFQGNQLLGYSDIASVDPVAVPLRSGTTPVQVRMYGPAGEEVVTTLLYQTPVSLLRRDALEYSVAAGACAAACDEFAHADVRYGVTSLFTVGGGLEMFRDSAGSSLRPYFVYSLSSGLRATAELTYMPFALYSADVSVFPRDGSRASIRSSISRSGLGPISLVAERDMRWDLEAHWDERIERRESRFSQLRFGAAAAGELGEFERWRVSSMASFSRGFLEARYDHDNTAARTHLLSARAAVYTPFTFRSRTLRPLINAGIGIGEIGVRILETGVSVQPRANAVITAGAQWSRGSSRPMLSIGYSARTGSVHSALRAISSAAGVASSSFRMSGSSSFAHDGSVTVHPSARTGYSGLRGTVFIDRNGDNVFSDGDDVVPGAHLVAGGFRTVSDDEGRYRIWGMQPYRPIQLAIDSTRTPDPSLTTSRSDIIIRPAPNMARRVDIQLVNTSELIGTLTAAPDVSTVAGISLDITDVESGISLATVTFSDGMFYVSRVRPGRYRITVSPASLDAIGAAALPAVTEFTITGSGDEMVVELPPIHLQRR